MLYNVSVLPSSHASGFFWKFGIEDLKVLPDQTGCWDGVRNYQVELKKTQTFSFSVGISIYIIGHLQARNFMRQMKEGQSAFFYHSNCKEPGIAGIMKVSPSISPAGEYFE